MNPVDPTGPSNMFLNIITLLVLGSMQAVSMFINKRRGEKTQQAQEANVKAQVLNQEITERKMAEIHTLVNGPLGIALDALATALERHAHTTLDESDIVAAVAARKASSEHNRKQTEANDARRQVEADRARVVAEFIAKSGKKIPDIQDALTPTPAKP